MTDARSSEIVWRPDEQIKADANLSAFMERRGVSDFDALNRRAATDPAWFWNSVIEHFDLRFDTPYESVIDESQGKPWARWCVGGTTNVVLNALDRHRDTSPWERTIIEWEGEDGARRAWSYAELDRETCRLANALRELGIGKGDVVGIYMPMLPETAAAFLTIAKIGAIVLPLFSGFGAGAVTVRCNDAGAKAIITVDGTRRRGKTVPMKAILDQAATDISGLRHLIVLEHLGIDVNWHKDRDHSWREVTQDASVQAPTEVVPADHPLMIVYTSGTTGKPKGAVLTHCGFPVKLALDLGLCLDFKPEDRMLWMSDMGWVVGPIQVVGVSMLGGTMVLAEGAPDYPQPGRMWRLIQDFRVSFLGIAPTIARSMMAHSIAEADTYDLSSLRIMASTGEPWNPDSWLWTFRNIGKSKVPILNYTGGTEVGGGILTGTVLHPLKPCSFAGSVPGMAADVVDERGERVVAGQVGELVMRQPSIGLTRGLWNDPERYLDTYWRIIPDLWVHGDFASIDSDGYWYVHGRSDDTIKIAGKRTGPAEIESLLLATGRVREAAAVGVPDDIKGQAVVCVCAADQSSDTLALELSDAVVFGLGAAFRPREIVFASDLPKTRNMKIMRRVVRSLYTGQDPGDLSSLVNPEVVDELERAFGR